MQVSKLPVRLAGASLVLGLVMSASFSGAQTRGAGASGPPAEAAQRIAALRGEGKSKGWTFEVANNPAFGRPLSQLAATKAPENFEEGAKQWDQVSQRLGKIEQERLSQLGATARTANVTTTTCSVADPVCDYQPKMPAVRNQGTCGSCWAFGAMGAWEGVYSLRHNVKLDTSEQHVLTCSGAGTCGGGWYTPVYVWMIGTGARSEGGQPYLGSGSACQTAPLGSYKVANWNYVTTSPGPAAAGVIKQALVTRGPLVATIYATGAFQAYASGVFNENANPVQSNGTPVINHAIVIVGWDDTKGAWRVRNSWSAGWGEGGYAWVAYGSNNIGAYAAWVSPVKLGITWNPYNAADLMVPTYKN